MPWSPSEASKHNKRAIGAAGSQWSAIANRVLNKTGNEGKAIKIANAAIRRRRTKSGRSPNR